MSALTATSMPKLFFAAHGVSKVKRQVKRIPSPKTLLPPTTSATIPPGIWSTTYPKKKEESTKPWEFSSQSKSNACENNEELKN